MESMRKKTEKDNETHRIIVVTAKTMCIMMAATCLATPVTAHAIGWDVQEEADAVGASQSAAANAQPATIAPIFTAITNWAVGIAVAIFVLRVAMTALDRFVFSGQGAAPALKLSEIPFIGAYPDPDDLIEMDEANANAYAAQHGHTKNETLWTWGRIWKRFAIQMGIIAGVWILMRVLLGVVIMLSQATAVSS
jgi:hypothetical protein